MPRVSRYTRSRRYRGRRAPTRGREKVFRTGELYLFRLGCQSDPDGWGDFGTPEALAHNHHRPDPMPWEPSGSTRGRTSSGKHARRASRFIATAACTHKVGSTEYSASTELYQNQILTPTSVDYHSARAQNDQCDGQELPSKEGVSVTNTPEDRCDVRRGCLGVITPGW